MNETLASLEAIAARRDAEDERWREGQAPESELMLGNRVVTVGQLAAAYHRQGCKLSRVASHQCRWWRAHQTTAAAVIADLRERP